jgi:uncharacterized protein YqcC (DUF446 family)
MKKVRALLQALENELNTVDKWSLRSPDRTQLNSQLPFCYDTLPLEMWLQWIFVPRISALLDANAALPQNCAIAPYAKEVWKTSAMLPVIKVLRDLDTTFEMPT